MIQRPADWSQWLNVWGSLRTHVRLQDWGRWRGGRALKRVWGLIRHWEWGCWTPISHALLCEGGLGSTGPQLEGLSFGERFPQGVSPPPLLIQGTEAFHFNYQSAVAAARNETLFLFSFTDCQPRWWQRGWGSDSGAVVWCNFWAGGGLGRCESGWGCKGTKPYT